MPKQKSKFNIHMKPSGTDADIVEMPIEKCPNCKIKLDKIFIRKKEKIYLRECSKCDYVWGYTDRTKLEFWDCRYDVDSVIVEELKGDEKND